MKTNKKLKGIYFYWAINYEGPPPRSFATTFEEHLLFERYKFCDEKWLEKVLTECTIANKEDFDQHVALIEKDFEKYSEQQNKKRERRRDKKRKIHNAECAKLGVLPF